MADDFLHGDVVERVGAIVPDVDIGDPESITGTHYYNHSSSGINDNDPLRREGRLLPNIYSQTVQGSRSTGIVNSVSHYPATYASMGSRGNASTVGTSFGGGSLMSTLPVATVLPYASQTHTTTVSYGVDHTLDPNSTAPGPMQTMASNSCVTGSVGNVYSSPDPVTFVATEELKGCQLCKHTFQNSTELLKHMQDFHQVDTQHVVQNRAALDKRLSHKLNQNSLFNPVPAVSVSATTAPFMSSVKAPVVNNMPFICPQTTASFPSSATISTSTTAPVNQSQVDSNGNSNSLIPGVLYRVESNVISNKSCTEESSAPSSTVAVTGLPPPDLRISLEPDFNVHNKKRNPPGLLTSLLQQQLELMNGEPIVRSVDGNLTPKQERQAVEMIVTECLSDFYCKMCLEKFNDRETGIAHAKRQHLGWKPFQCSNCPMRFATAALRKIHKLALHTNPVNQNARSEQASNDLIEVTSVSSIGENTIDTKHSAALTSQASTNKVLPLSYITPAYPSFGFYVDSATESPKEPLDNVVNALKSTDQEGVCILPDDEIPQEQTYTDNSKNNYLNPVHDNPVHLRIFETQNPTPLVKTAQKGPIPHDISQPQSSESRLNYTAFVSTDGTLNGAQIEFAANMIEQLASKKFRCKICYQEVMHRKHALNHVRHLHLKELYKCPGCGDMFTSKALKDRHRSECHKDRAPIPNHQKEYPVVNDPVGIHPTELQAHALRSVEKYGDKFRCKKCKKTFKARGHAISHIRQSHFGRSHMCNSCGYFFEDDLLVHRSKCNTTAQISPKKGPSESDAETTGIVSNEVQHLRSMMENSIQRAVIRNQSQSWDVNYQCQLCSSQFDKRSNAEAHLWIEHIRNEWALTSGSSNVDSIYLQFLQEQFTNPLNSTGSTNKNQEAINPSSGLEQQYMYAESMDNIEPEIEDSSNYMNFEGPEDEEEMVFDPASMSENQIYVEEAGNNVNIESAHGDDGLSLDGMNPIQCKVELEEPQEVHGQFDDGENDNDNFENADSNDNDYGGDIGIGDSVNDESNDRVSDDEQTPFKVVSYSSTGFEKIKKSSIKSEPGIQLEENVDTPETTRTSRLKNRNITSTTNQADEAISNSIKNSTVVVGRSASKNKVTEGLDSGKLVPSALLSEAELNQLNVKALRFIREKTGQYYCIVCQRKTKLRRQLVEHVRRVHLCGESDLEEGASIPSGKNLGGTPDNENRMYCCYCEDIFSAVGERKFHERHCLSRTSALALDVSNSTGVNVTKGIGPLPTTEQRALRFIRPDKNEFICTICKIRATKADRLITHVSTIHFGDNSQKCPKCNKDFPEGVSRKKHTAHCRGGQGAGAVALGGRTPPKNIKSAKSKSKFKKTGVRSNFYVDSNGRLKKKIGRPFVNNVDNTVLRNKTSSGNSLSTTSKASATGSTRSTETLIDIVSDDNEEDIASDNDNDATQDPDWEPNASPSSAPPSPPPRSVSPTIGEPETPDPVPPPTVVAKPVSPQENTKVVATKKPSKSSVKLVGAPDSKGRLTAEQIKRAKKMIIAWSVGGKYSFSKCSECSVLFTKYENAESHIRKLHFGEGQRGGTIEPSEEHNSSTNGNESDNIVDISEDDNTATESSSSKKRPNDIDLKDSAAANKKSKPNDPQDSGSEEDVYLNNDDNDGGFSEPEPEIDQMDCIANDGGNSSQEKDVSLEAVSPSKVNPRRIKMSMASVSADVLKKKYMIPKRVSKVLTTLTSKEFSDSQSYILKIDQAGYQCKECGAKFPRLNNISRHVRQKHFVERPHHCLKCDERFFHNNQFETHKKLCEGKLSEINSESEIEKSPTKSPKLLTQSGARVPSEAESIISDKLNDQKDEDPMKFMERLSKKGKQRKYRCQICRLVLSSFGSCLKHIQKLHFGATPFKCEKCGENFRYSKTFQNHKNVCHDKPEETAVQAEDVSLVSCKDEKVNASKATASSRETTVPSSGSYGGNRFTESKHFVCKLCGEKLPDKPLVRYHLVSVHYGELQNMGQGMKFFDAASDKLVDDLTMECSGSSKPVETSNEIARTLEDTGLRLTRNTEKELGKILSVSSSSHSTSLIENETSNHSKNPDEALSSCSAAAMSSSSECNISENMGLDFEEDGNNVKIHNSEKELLASLQEIKPYRLPDGSMEIFKKATVRIQQLRFNGILPASLQQAAKELCVKHSDPHSAPFTCRKCGKGFGTFSGCYGHVRIQHYGEHRYQCTICHRFLTDGLSNHMKACKKQSAKLRKAENSQGDLKLKRTELLSTEEHDHNLMGGECGMSEASQACVSEYSCSKTDKESKKPGNLRINEMHQTGSQTLNVDCEVKVNSASLAVVEGPSSPSQTSSNKSGILNDEQISQAHSLIREIVESAVGSKKKKILYECTFCKLKDEKFARIRRHAREVHFGEKPYGCNYCGKRFSKTSDEREHSWICSVKILSQASEVVQPNPVTVAIRTSSVPSSPETVSSQPKSIIRKSRKKSKSKKSKKSTIQFGSPSSNHSIHESQDSGRSTSSSKVKFDFHKSLKSQDRDDSSAASTTTAAAPIKVNLPVVFIKEERAEETDLELPEI